MPKTVLTALLGALLSIPTMGMGQPGTCPVQNTAAKIQAKEMDEILRTRGAPWQEFDAETHKDLKPGDEVELEKRFDGIHGVKLLPSELSWHPFHGPVAA
ncbi:MAG: hypothetical protein AB7E46_06620 [Desulfovibrio sp.]|jgi:hypothetical protein